MGNEVFWAKGKNEILNFSIRRKNMDVRLGIQISVLAWVLFLLSACAPITRVSRYDSNSAGQRPSQKVDVFSSPTSVPYPFREIGLITIDDDGWGRSEAELLDKAIEQAKIMGADGLIILNQD